MGFRRSFNSTIIDSGATTFFRVQCIDRVIELHRSTNLTCSCVLRSCEPVAVMPVAVMGLLEKEAHGPGNKQGERNKPGQVRDIRMFA
jgi:hypothetical protein